MKSNHIWNLLRSGGTRRAVLVAVAGVAVAGAGWTQVAYPDKPIRVVVPFGAGSSPDVISRLWGERLSKVVGQPVIIDNKPGAATIIGTQAVLSAPSDGYTFLYTVSNTTSINPYIYKSLPYKAEDLMPVIRVLSVPLVMVVSGNSPINTVQDLVRSAKDRPGKMNYPSYGVGTSTHVAMARFSSAAGITMTHVPYKDGGLTDVMSGTVDVSFEPSTTAMGQIKAGKLRALGVTSTRPVAALPGVPPLADAFPRFAGDSWHGIFAGKGTPAPVISRIASISQQIIDSEEFRKRLTELGLVPAGGSVPDFQAFLADDAKAWAKVVKDYDIKAE
jgi:tripartite-type tricarboxylate transporter receptor subunit TctC